VVKAPDRLRFVVPLHRVAEAARIVDVPASTRATWAQGYVRRPDGHAYVAGDPIITYGRTASTGIPQDQALFSLTASEPT
jgi:hypothetical protein